MIIELTNYFNWQGSQLSPGQVLHDLPDGLVNNLINAGNAKLWTPAKVKTDDTVQNITADLSTRQDVPAGRVPAYTTPIRVEKAIEVGKIGIDTGKPKPSGRPARSRNNSTTGKATGKTKAK
jgi:hypothetical protein